MEVGKISRDLTCESKICEYGVKRLVMDIGNTIPDQHAWTISRTSLFFVITIIFPIETFLPHQPWLDDDFHLITIRFIRIINLLNWCVDIFFFTYKHPAIPFSGPLTILYRNAIPPWMNQCENSVPATYLL